MSSSTALGAAVRPRRDLRWIAAGVLAICLAGLGAGLLYTELSRSVSAVTVKRTVYRDQVITEADLGVTAVAPVPGVELVPSDQLAGVVGQTARLDLTEGSLLSPRGFGAPVTEPGQVRLGLRLSAGRIPAAALPPGTAVLLVPVAGEGTDPPAGGSIAGEIATPAATLPDGASIIDVTVAQLQAERLARLAAADQVVLVQLPGGER